MQMALLRFFESLPAALAVGLLLLPRLIDEDGTRFKKAIAIAAGVRAALGFLLIAAIARAIIPADRSIDGAVLVEFAQGTTVGRAWIVTEIIAFVFAAATIARLFVSSVALDSLALGLGALVISATSVTGHAIDDSFAWYTQASFFFHTLAGLAWIGGLLGLVWWMYTGRDKPPEVAAKLAERWSTIAKAAIVIVLLSGFMLVWENVGSFANLFATTYGRLLALKLALFAGSMFAALALALYLHRRPAGEFDFAWYERTGLYEAVAAVGLLFIAGWIAVITPASHETDLYWPFPFRFSWAATWGYIGLKLPWVDTPGWYLAPAWSGVGALVSLAAAAVLWWAPQARAWRMKAAPAALVTSLAFVALSFVTQAYPDTYNDPTEDYTAESINRGQKHFSDNCVSCHGAGGEGNGEAAKSLAVAPADLTAPHVGNHTIGDIFHWLTFGGTSGVMPSFKDMLDVDDRWDMINYLLILSNTNQSRFFGPRGMVQGLVAPDFQLEDPTDQTTALSRLRGVPTLISFARCDKDGEAKKALEDSLAAVAKVVKEAGANQVTVYQGECPKALMGRTTVHPAAVESAYSVINRYPNEQPSRQIEEGHFLIDRSGFVRARFRHFDQGDGMATQLAAQIATMAREPIVVINLHSH
jgi:copper transport protein